MDKLELTLREELFPHWVIYALLLIIVVFSVLKYQKEMVFVHLKGAFFNPPSSIPTARESLSFLGGTNWLLLLNYFGIAGLAMYMLLVYFKMTAYWLVFLPAVVYIFQLLALFLAGLLSGEPKKLRENILLLNFTAHVTGIVLVPLLLIWILNPHLSAYMVKSIGGIFILFYIIRLLRGMFLAIRNKVLWYYIILYLCGLEIWSLIVGYLLLSPVFIG